ncbi:MAG: NAD-binding protein [Candidatus Lokiarchaeota archaeon]|nr:NAD-binding protein [Candidatus Lokiarchaeota archaeon]
MEIIIMENLEKPSSKIIGLIGIGLVGTSLAINLIAHDYKVIGFDINEKQMKNFEKIGGMLANSPADIAEKTDVIVFSLLTSDIVLDVIRGKKGILSANKYPTTIIDTTTADPIKTDKIYSILLENNIDYLDATISGSSVQIKEREGTFMVGGNKSVYERHGDIFSAVAKETIYVGSSGTGARAKLAVNLVVGLNRWALAEALVFAQAIGLDLQKTLEIFTKTQAYSSILDAKGEKMINNDFTTQSRIRQHRKDVSLMIKMAQKENLQLQLSAQHLQLLDNMIKNGDGDLDVSSVIKAVRNYGLGNR